MKLYEVSGEQKDLGNLYDSGYVGKHASAEALAQKQIRGGGDGVAILEYEDASSDILYWNPKTDRLEKEPNVDDMPLALQYTLAGDEEALFATLERLAEHKEVKIRLRVARNAGSPERLLLRMAKSDKSPKVKKAAKWAYDRMVGKGD